MVDPKTRPEIPQAVVEGFQRLLSGELSHRLPDTGPDGEPDEIARFFNPVADEIELKIQESQASQERLNAAVAAISDALIHVAGADYGVRIDRDFGGGQLDVLAFLVNSTIDELGHVAGENQRRAEEMQQELEQRVQQRTRELTAALSHLEQAQAELVEARKAAEEGRRQAEAANRAKSTFLANMSHELRSPLNAILGFTQILARSPELSDKHLEYLDIVDRSGEHLLSLINDILDLSKIEAGRMTVDVVPFAPHDLLHDVEDMFRLRAVEKGLTLTFEVGEDVPDVIASDDVKLRQILINLMNNAVKFTEEGGISVRVHGHLPEPGAARLRFEVEDTGPGIAGDLVQAAFDSFGQLQTGRHRPDGTGLGLTISQRFVQLLGGEIEVHSVIGEGSRFSFEIECPVGAPGAALPAEARRGEVARWRRARALAPDQRPSRLLIVDDTADNRAVLVAILAPFGFEIREAANGEEAVGIWQRWHPDLIFMDIRMPVMDGYEATRRIKGRDGGGADATAPVIIAVTASSYDEHRNLAMDAGCDDHISKPFRDGDILAAVHRHLGVRFLFDAPADEPTPQGEGASWEMPALLEIPEALLSQMEELLEIGDVDRIEAVIDEIAAHDAEVGAHLRVLADRFDHDRMLARIQALRAENEA